MKLVKNEIRKRFSSFNKTTATLLSELFDGLGPLACSDIELTSETMNPFRHFGRTP